MTHALSFGLDGKVALITGASRGIGAAIARGLAAHGADVILASRGQEDLDLVAESINEAGGGRAVAVACHTGRTEAIERLFERVRGDFGRLDVLINNAATNPEFGPAVATSEEALHKTLEVNVKGYFVMSQHAARMMIQQGSGSIINIASILGIRPQPNMVVYAMTKAAVINMTAGDWPRSSAASGIRVNAIAPGVIETKFAAALLDNPVLMSQIRAVTPLGRHGQPEEIVGAALFPGLGCSLLHHRRGDRVRRRGHGLKTGVHPGRCGWGPPVVE